MRLNCFSDWTCIPGLIYGLFVLAGIPLVGAAITVYKRDCNLVCDYNLFQVPRFSGKKDKQGKPYPFKGTIGCLVRTGRIKELADWRKATGLNTHSVHAKPVFVDPENGDFRLKPGSPGLAAADDGGPVGARP